MNKADSERLDSALGQLGLSPINSPQNADVIVLNSCVVRQSAEDKVTGMLTSLKSLKQRSQDTIVALMNNEATLKRYYLGDKGVELHPQNPDFDIIHVKPADDFQINGIVLAVLREYS